MDNFETSSTCSEASKSSECLSSNISTFSGLSEYQDEFMELKQLINQGNLLSDATKSGRVAANIIQCYEKQIANLNAQLQNALKQNERYKNDVYNLEKKNDLIHGDKIEKLLKQNKQLEANLSAANNQIKRLIDICHKKEDFDASFVLLEQKNLQLEQVNNELTNQIYLLSNKINHHNFQKNEIEHDCKNLKSELNDLKLELCAKTECVNELKRKLSEQHVQLQDVVQNNVKLSHSLEIASNELQHAKKSENWYKEELQRIQQEKNRVSDKILQNEKLIASQEEDLERLNLEIKSLKCSFDEIRLTALKDKEEMCKHIQTMNYKKCLTNEDKKSDANCDNIVANIGNVSNYYETVINDLTSDVEKIKSDFEQQQKRLQIAAKEKSDILSKYLTLQSSLSEKDRIIEKLEDNIKDLKNKLLLANNDQEKQNLKLFDLKKTCKEMEIELQLRKEDKDIFEHTVVTVREQFKLLTSKYLWLKNELQDKSKEILRLQYEKQELTMNNNRKIAETKKVAEKDAIEIRNLKQKLFLLEGVQADQKNENRSQSETIVSLNVEIKKLESHLHELRTTHPCISKHENNANSIVDYVQETENIMNNIELLKYICKLCKMHEHDFTKNTSVGSDEEYMKLLLHKIESYHQFIDTQLTVKHRNKLTKRTILSKIMHLVHRCELLEKRAEDNAQMLKQNLMLCTNTADINFKEEIQRLRVQLEVKTQGEKEKQKRYERGYRTLLRKVKEHMKGRKIAEKRNDYLQELHDTLASELNALKLQLDLKESRLNELQNHVEKSSSTIEKLKSTVLKLQAEIKNFSCGKCVEFKTMQSRCRELETFLKESETNRNLILTELTLKKEQFGILQRENKQLSLENSSKCTKIIDLENKLKEAQIWEQQLQAEIVLSKESISKTCNENADLHSQLDHVTNQNVQLLEELKHMNSCLQRKSEEVNEFKLRKEQVARRWQETETNMQNLIATLKSQIFTSRSEIDLLRNEKFFLQRLCSDLNIALKTHISQNESLKEYVEKVLKESERTVHDSDILSKFPSPIKCDDTYIEKLLQENMMPFPDEPYCDIQESINSLKKEILCLQNQIADKNVTY